MYLHTYTDLPSYIYASGSLLPSPRNGSPHLRSQHTITVHPGHAWQPVWQGLPPVVWFASLSPVALVGCALRLCIDISNVFGNILYLGMTCGFGLRSRLALALGLWPHTTPTDERSQRRERVGQNFKSPRSSIDAATGNHSTGRPELFLSS